MASELSIDIGRVQAALSRWFTEETRQGLVATDANLNVVVWNRWMEMHSGLSASQVLGRRLLDLFPDAESRDIREYYEAALAGQPTVISHGLHRHLFAMPPTNTDLPYTQMPQSGQISPLSDLGRVIGTITTIEDVSSRLASEAELRTQIDAQELARATAEKALRSRDAFLSTLSHELRTPLNAVLGWARILLGRSDMDEAALRHALEVIERNASAQATMIDDMLDMARIAAGKLRLEMQPVDLLGVVLSTVDVAMPMANAREISIRTRLDPNTPRVLGDQDRLQQVLSNVLSNALKFTEPGGWVEVLLETDRRFARVIVKDSGQGISPEFLPYIFDRFRQNDASSARRHGGLGLGLALVRELAELHGGVVTADSKGVNQGTTITIELPVAPVDVLRRYAKWATTEKGPMPSLSGVRVLVVEDEPDARDLTMTALEQCGAHVVAVPSGGEALDQIRSASAETRAHVLVSDIGLPGQDGYALIRGVRALAPECGGQIQALAVSGYAAPKDIERALAAGFQRHVSKPIDPGELVKAVALLASADA